MFRKPRELRAREHLLHQDGTAMPGYNREEVLPFKNVLAIENLCSLGKSKLPEDVLRSPVSRFSKCDSVAPGRSMFNRTKHKLLANAVPRNAIGNPEEI